MTTTATEVRHTAWCNDHADADPDQPGDTGTCSWQRRAGRGENFVNVEEGENGSPPYVAVWGDGNALTVQEARTMAADILEAVDIVEGEVVRERGALTMGQIEGMTLSELLDFARRRGVRPSDVIRVAEEDVDRNA